MTKTTTISFDNLLCLGERSSDCHGFCAEPLKQWTWMVPEVKNVFFSALPSLCFTSYFENQLKKIQEYIDWDVSAYNFKSKTDFQQHETVHCLMIICLFRHFLFRSEAREDPYTDYYIWKDANSSNPGGVPNNWWGISAVQFIGKTQQNNYMFPTKEMPLSD